MQTISIDIEESKIDIILNILKHLKDDVIDSYTISSKIDKNYDPFFDKRKKRLKKLRDDIKLGKMPMYDFESSMDELIRELES